MKIHLVTDQFVFLKSIWESYFCNLGQAWSSVEECSKGMREAVSLSAFLLEVIVA